MGKWFEGAAAWAQPEQVPEGVEIERSQPSRPASFTSDVLVPAAQAAVTGCLLGALVTFIVLQLAPELGDQAVKVWAVASLAISGVAWLSLLGQTRRLLWTIETVTGLDLDRDGTAGRPTHTEHVSAVLEDGNGNVLPGGIDTEALDWNRNGAIAFCRATLKLSDFTEGRWGKTDAFGKSITAYRRIRGELEAMGYLERTGESSNASWQLTRAGRAIFSKIAALPYSG